MTDTVQATTPDTQAVDGQQTEQENPNSEGKQTLSHEAALAELEKTRREAAEYRKKLRTVEQSQSEQAKAQEAAEAKRLAEQGEFKALYEAAQARIANLEPLEARYQEFVDGVKAANERRIAGIPASMRGLVPEYDDPMKLNAWLEANGAMLQKQPAPGLNGGAGGNGPGTPTVTDAEVLEFATRMGINPAYVDRAAVAKAYKR